MSQSRITSAWRKQPGKRLYESISVLPLGRLVSLLQHPCALPICAPACEIAASSSSAKPAAPRSNGGTQPASATGTQAAPGQVSWQITRIFIQHTLPANLASGFLPHVFLCFKVKLRYRKTLTKKLMPPG